MFNFNKIARIFSVKAKKMVVKASAGEHGSALVLVMFIALLLTILGTAVLSAAVGGAQRAETRENDVQSLHLAEKTLEEVIAGITSNLQSIVTKSIDGTQEKLERDVDLYLSGLEQGSYKDLMTSTELTNATGKLLQLDYKKVSYQQQAAAYHVTLTVEAEVNGVQRELTQEVIYDTYPDFLKYTLGSENDLTINGSPYIQGNIYAGNNLRIGDKAKYYYQSRDVQTLFSSPLQLDGEAHIQSLKQVLYTLNDTTKSAEEWLSEGASSQFIIPEKQLRVRNHRKFVQLNVRESFVDKVIESLKNSAIDRSLIRKHINNHTLGEFLRNYPVLYDAPDQIPTKPGIPEQSDKPEDQHAWAYYRNQIERFTKPDKSFIYHGDLTYDGVELGGIEYESKSDHWFVVDGDLTINNYKDTPIMIKANMLVTGKLQIRGNVQLDSTIYVLGPSGGEGYATLVEDAAISGSGVVMSEGAVLINRLDAFQSKTEVIQAFFYTDSTAELYGVGSILSLSGGFFAKGDLTVNAVRGETFAGNGVIQITPGTNLVRFSARYNEEVYKQQQKGLPRVNQMSVQVGPIKLN
ncbi:hypothetical protein QPK24_17635 [Paenibacillus polygoni]|uniref:Uncharacterized protein n=1 Tax=Paenibacillus polygoni TaxID=3050112 RepID=A0ABY8X0I8_9BACL|nr:hypothetical protein [Paenibacillus polygoni]WIV18209.1 hypothetical protein QPK24_17635 [Paenibacillus polygoni]